MCLCFIKVLKNVILTSLFLGGEGREGKGTAEITEQVDHNVVDFIIGCKITNAYNKQNYIFSLKI